MSATSRLLYTRSAAAQPATNLFGPAAVAVAGGSGVGGGSGPGGLSPSSGGMARGGQPAQVGQGATFPQIVFGLAALVLIWWAITWILERLLPLHDTPQFFRDWLHGLKIALIVAFWFILWKMSAGVAPFKSIEPYRTIAVSV